MVLACGRVTAVLPFGRLRFVVGPAAGKPFRNDVLLALYSPFIHFVIALGGYSGESGMIWPPVFGVLLGVLIYSAILATVVSFFSARRFRN